MSEHLTTVTCSLCGAIIVGLSGAKVLQSGGRIEHIHADAERCIDGRFDASIRDTGNEPLRS